MTDRMTPEQRHRCMSHIKGRGTRPELAVRQWLWHHGYRYRLNVKSVPGKPDIVLRPYRTAIFVNGCFWHGHNVDFADLGNYGPDPQLGVRSNGLQIKNSACCKIPQSNRAFWVAKIRRNQQRDARNQRLLQENGWQVIVIWECQLKPADRLERTMRQVEQQLNDNLLSRFKKSSKPYPSPDEPLPLAAEGD